MARKWSPDEQRAIRADVFRWLDDLLVQHGMYELSRQLLLSYTYDGERIPLLDTSRGIRNPAQFESTLTIMTSWKQEKYDDNHDDDGWVTYSYQAREGGDNRKLLRAFELREPLVYFQAVREGYYYPYYPVRIAENDPVQRRIRFPVAEELTWFGDPGQQTPDQRAYAERLVRQRVHQPRFRARVLYAYRSTCGVCSLQHAELLDAAHIIADRSEGGVAHVTNGIALCKIHHAAYDRNLMGIDPDYKIHIDRELLDEVDGPMLRHGLQDMHHTRLHVPRRVSARPDRDALAQRFAEFASY